MSYLNKTPMQLILEIRETSQMTDTEIAEASGMSQSTVSRLRSGALNDTSSENWRSLVHLYEIKVNQKAA